MKDIYAMKCQVFTCYSGLNWKAIAAAFWGAGHKVFAVVPANAVNMKLHPWLNSACPFAVGSVSWVKVTAAHNQPMGVPMKKQKHWKNTTKTKRERKRIIWFFQGLGKEWQDWSSLMQTCSTYLSKGISKWYVVIFSPPPFFGTVKSGGQARLWPE